jgi:colicin import membrane protein
MATAKKAKRSTTGTVARIESSLPKTLREYSRSVQRELARIERDVEKVTATTRKKGIKLLREASHELGRLEQQGEKAWKRLSTPYRRRAVTLLKQLEKAVAPPTAARKKVAKKTTKKAATRKSPARKKTATRKKSAKRA